MSNIKDVAVVAGVTVTTVSRVLNNRGYISEATRKKVYDAMEQLDYQPNEIARSLFRKKSSVLGLIVPDISHPFFAEMAKHIEFYAYCKGYKILFCNSYQDSRKEKDYIDMLKRHQVDGIIMGSHSLETSEYQNLKLPIVAIDRNLSDDIPYVTSDNFKGGYLATQLLIKKGCKKLAHISGPLTINTPVNRRYEGFLQAVNEVGMEHILIETPLPESLKYEHRKMETELLTSHPDIDGIFASSDLIAARLVDVARSMKKKVPADLRIIGFDDIGIASLMSPALTTVRQPIAQMGELIVELMEQKINGEEVEIENMLPIQLIERKST